MAIPRDPDPITAIFAGLTGATALLVLILAATALFGTEEDQRLDGRALTKVSGGMSALRAEQGALLTGYRRLPGERVALPIERAMEVVLPELQALGEAGVDRGAAVP